MAGQPLVPIGVARDSIVALSAERGPGGQVVYLIILSLVVLGLGLLPVVRVPVSVESGGIIRPALEKHEVRAGVTGIAASIRVRENQWVGKGEPVATLRLGSLGAEHRLLQHRLAEARRVVSDLEALVGADPPTGLPPGRLATSRFRLELDHLLATLEEQRKRVDQAAREAARARALRERELIPQAELEQLSAAHEREAAAAALLLPRTRRDWAASLSGARESLRDLEAREAELRQRRELHTITAPVSGTVEQLARVSPGSLVQAGEPVAVISPGAELVAEVFVTPREIGLLRPGAPVRMRVDAFPSSEWGFLSGRIAEIPADFVLVDQAPRYRVKVALLSRSLSLPNGTRGALRKGMTLRARFLLAERSLWQLLRDDVDDWFGPAPDQGPTP